MRPGCRISVAVSRGSATLLLLAVAHGALSPQAIWGDEQAIRQTVEGYVAAFNQGDAAAVAAFWAPNGVHVQRDTEQRTEGREQIQQDFQSLFQGEAPAKLEATVTSVRLVKPDVALVEGQTRVTIGSQDPSEGTYVAVFVQTDGKWLIDNSRETVAPPKPKPADYLQEFDWLVGTWKDDASPEIQVETTVRWATNRSFLVRTYTVQRENELTYQGTEVVGWDPRSQQVRSWMFDSDGSFGEGTWTSNDDGWTVKIVRTLPDGRLASGKQVVTKVDANALTVESVGLEIGGEPQPSKPAVRVIRVADTE